MYNVLFPSGKIKSYHILDVAEMYCLIDKGTIMVPYEKESMFTDADFEQALRDFKGPVVVGKLAKPRPSEKTFRNNKYTVFNQGRIRSTFKHGAYITIDKITDRTT
jgi:hypothetical protein